HYRWRCGQRRHGCHCCAGHRQPRPQLMMGMLIATTAVGNVASGSADSGDPVKIGGVYNSSAPTLTTGQRADAQLDVNGNLKVNVTNGIGSGTQAAPSSQIMSATPAASVGLGASMYTVIAPATVAAETVKASAGTVYAVHAYNVMATPVYLKLYDATSITLGTTAASWQAIVPGNTAGAGVVIPLPVGLKFATGIMLTVTGGIALTDNTAITANSCGASVAYI
ncbi:MAG: hypothetical protein KGL39_55810, partial [Patescibacteria group bacterium]|nr:hypothetical protein [Patescibacteria group bacterium]